MKLYKPKLTYWQLALVSGLLSVLVYKLLQVYPSLIDEFLIGFIVVTIVLLLNPIRRFYRAFGALLTLFSSLLIIPALNFTSDINIQGLKGTERRLYNLIVDNPHWVVYLILGLLMTATLILDYFERKKPKTSNSINDSENFTLMYNLNKDSKLKEWVIYKPNSSGKVEFLKEFQGFKLESKSNNIIGINKSMNTLKGKVTFDYQICKINNTQDNLLIYVIPMQSNEHNKLGYIEVGTEKQSHPDNPFSPFRKKLLLHKTNIKDWNEGIITFDFSNTPNAFYTVFAPRINEGSPRASDGEFLIKNIKIYK